MQILKHSNKKYQNFYVVDTYRRLIFLPAIKRRGQKKCNIYTESFKQFLLNSFI